MVKLICFVRRKAGMSPEEFHRYWRESHGPLVASTKSGSHVIRYEQNHRALDDYGREGPSDFDGVTEQWFESVDDLYSSLQEDDYRLIAYVFTDFMDTENIVWIMTEEPEVVVDGP